MPKPNRHAYDILMTLPLEAQIEPALSLCRADPSTFAAFTLGEIQRRESALKSAGETIEQLAELNAKLTTPAWQTAPFLGLVELRGEQRARVVLQGSERALALDSQVSIENLSVGCEVIVSAQGCVLGVSGQRPATDCATAVFVRLLGERLILRHHDDEFVVRAAAQLDIAALRPGDRVLFDRRAQMAFECVAGTKDHAAFLAEIPSVHPSSIGGLDREYRKLKSVLMGSLHAPEINRLYGLCGQRSVLLVGPAGCGKTLLVKVIASEFTRSGRPTRVAVVKPASWESPFVGETQENIRNFFAALRAEAESGPIIVFLDEVDAIGRTRGGATSQHADKFLAALLPELDGFEDRGDVTIVAATNRKDLLDTALLQRVSGVEVAVGRPNMQAARAIFSIHLPETLLYSPNGSEAPATRSTLVEGAVSRMYAPNADNQIARLKFRDGKERIVTAGELLCGRVIKSIAENARTTARDRHVERGEKGVNFADLEGALDDAIEQMRTTLSPENAQQHLPDLARDAHVTAVEALRPKTNRRRYMLP